MKKSINVLKFIMAIFLLLSLSLSLGSCYYKKTTVTFDYNYMGKQAVQVPINGFLTEPALPERTGYVFDGWYHEEKQWIFSEDTTNDNIVLIAKWIPQSYTLTLDTNGGICDTESITVYFEQPYRLPEVTKEGYHFAGWYIGNSHHLVEDEIWTYTTDKMYQAKWSVLPEGTTVTFGAYEQDNNRANGAEPIDWLVLDEKDGKYLLISQFVLDGQHYNELESKYNLWKDSYIRTWLNTYFLEVAFSLEEQKAIAETYLSDVDTTDKIFFLNHAETLTLLLNDTWCLGKCTPYALSLGLKLNVSNERYKSWHLRDGDKHARFSAAAASGVFMGKDVGRGLQGCRPVLWINKDAVLLN